MENEYGLYEFVHCLFVYGRLFFLFNFWIESRGQCAQTVAVRTCEANITFKYTVKFIIKTRFIFVVGGFWLPQFHLIIIHYTINSTQLYMNRVLKTANLK